MTFIIDGGGASLDGRRLDSAGAGTWTAPLNQAIVLSNGAVFNNNGLLDAQDNSRIVAGVGAASSFNNNGTFRKSAGAGETEIRVPFTNNGTVDVQTGDRESVRRLDELFRRDDDADGRHVFDHRHIPVRRREHRHQRGDHRAERRRVSVPRPVLGR